MSAFDLENFMDQETTEQGSTQIAIVPPGEYPAVIDKIDTRKFDGKDGEPRYVMDVTWRLVNLDPEIIKELGRDNPTVRQSIWLDLTSQGGFDMGKGKNVGLNQVREALDQNHAGKPWSPKNLLGAGPALVVVSHRANKDDPTKTYSEVKKVGRMS